MSYETIRIARDARGVATLTLDRADKHNAMSAQMISELTEAAAQLGADPGVRVVVLTGAGESFCAGADLGWMREQFGASREQRMAEARRIAGMLGALNAMPKPLIGRVNGQAYAGGTGLMSVCDICVAVEDARFALTETRLGLIPATIGPYVMARIGEGAARRVFFSAKLFDAEEAREIGLVAKTVEPEDLDAAIEAEVKPYLAAAPSAVAEAKAMVRALGPAITPEIVEDSIRRLADVWETPEAQEGVAGFFERKKPSWLVK